MKVLVKFEYLGYIAVLHALPRNGLGYQVLSLPRQRIPRTLIPFGKLLGVFIRKENLSKNGFKIKNYSKWFRDFEVPG